MRRAGVIVALGTLLGILGAVATASPAFARGPKWQFMPEAPTFTVPADSCGFEIQGTNLVHNVFVKTLKAADGSTIKLFTGVSKISLTANGKTITATTSGPVKEIDFPGGSTTFLEKGDVPTVLMPAQQALFGCLACSCLRAR